jgi:GT2 family glycosyltransferase
MQRRKLRTKSPPHHHHPSRHRELPQHRYRLVYTNHQIIDTQGNSQGCGHRCQIPYPKDRLLVDFMTFHFRLMRRESFEQAGGINPCFEEAVDYDLCLRLSEITTIKH